MKNLEGKPCVKSQVQVHTYYSHAMSALCGGSEVRTAIAAGSLCGLPTLTAAKRSLLIL
jgi:hypothetical protein